MTQEEKQLLFKDLCARLPYGVMCKLSAKGADISITEKLDFGGLEHFIFGTMDVRPYLRPMSSMTDNEKMEVNKLGVCYDWAFHNDIYDTGISMEEAFLAISWFLEKHFDINYLIERGLALEAPEGMY